MQKVNVRRGFQVAAMATMFAAGFLFGSVSQHTAKAQLGEIGKEAEKAALQQAGGSGGMVGEVVQLGTAIVDMQQNVDSLQKNLDTLKKVKAALGG